MSKSGDNLVSGIAACLGPEGVYSALLPYVPSLQRPKNGSLEVKALCPDHDDTTPSWNWNLQKGCAHCFVCGKGVSFVGVIAQHTGRRPVDVLDGFCRQFGLPRPRSRILTLDDYAHAKQLPAEFLAERFGLRDSPEGLRLPYFDHSRNVLAERTRRRLGERPHWEKGTKASGLLYGLHGLRWIGPTGHIFAFEGESDLQTAWRHDLPALATPGATLGHKALAANVVAVSAHTVYGVPDRDKAGQQWLKRLHDALRCAGFGGKCLALALPTKDLSDLHLEAAGRFDDAFSAVLGDAKPMGERLREYVIQADAAASTFMGIADRILKTGLGTKGNDKVIMLAVARDVSAAPGSPISLPKNKLARRAGLPRRTFFGRLPGLLEAGLLVEVGDGLALGPTLVPK